MRILLLTLFLLGTVWQGICSAEEGLRFEDVSKAHGIRLQPRSKHPNKKIAVGQKNFENVVAKGYFWNISDVRFVDSNGDGRLDIFLLNNPSSLWNRHWLGVKSGGFKEVPPEDIDTGWFTAYRLLGFDFNGSGAQDILGTACIATPTSGFNNGRPGTLRFIQHPDNDLEKGIFALSKMYLWTSSITQLFADFDNDGVIDVATGAETFRGRTRDGNSRLNGGMLNGRHWELDRTKVPLAVGSQAVAADFDQDGLVDVLCRGGNGPVKLTLNKGCRTFEDGTKRSGLEGLPFGGPVAVADFNNDGLLDIFATGKNMSAGDAAKLYLNQGKGVFADATKASGLERKDKKKAFKGASGTASVADFDNDGLVDLFFCEGKRSRLFRNEGHGRFKEVSSTPGIVQKVWNESSNDCGDFDGDGLVDLLAITENEGPALMRNTTKNGHGWVNVRVKGALGNFEAAGAKVSVYKSGMAGNKKGLLGYREKIISSDFRMPNLLHFGLGANPSCDVQVVFPGGKTVLKKDVKKGASITVTAE